MTSLGEGDIQVGARIVGKARVLNVLADSAVFPRLALAVGVTLYEGEQFSSLEMRDAEGELRLSEREDALGSLQWAGARRFVRSSNYGHESEVRLVCDLDHWRLEQIERRRAGGTPVFWLEFWPILMSGGEVLDAQVAPIRFAVPRDQWLEFYAKVGGGGFEVIEVHFPGRDADRFRKAVERTREARNRILEGEYDGAVALCRNVIEALGHEVGEGSEKEALQAVFARCTDARRAKEYAGVVSKVKQLAAFAHHELGALTYSRDEAQFVVRVTEAILSLIGGLTRPSSPDA